VTIDGLLPDPRRRGCVRVSVGGRPAWTVPAAVVTELRLMVGDTVGAGAMARLESAAEAEGALRAGLRMLEHRAHGRQELHRKLELKGHAEAAVRAAVEALVSMGLLDDRAFAEAYVAARAGRGRGPDRLRRDLAALGVEPTVSQAAIGALAQSGVADPWLRALEQATRRARTIGHLPRQVQIRRLTAFLARRGFTGTEAHSAVRAMLEGETARSG
jgi:regulatory protein